MVRILKTLSVLSLVSASVVFSLCIIQWRHGSQKIEHNQELPIVEKFSLAGSRSANSSQTIIPPLVKQAEAFALYLNPPPPKSNQAQTPRKRTISTERPVKVTPKFKLIATSYYRSRPEESVALVSEPGRETRWVKQGTRLGHFVVEEVGRGMIVYQDGDQLCKMAVDMKVPVDIAQTQQTALASDQTRPSPPRSSIPDKPRTRTQRAMHRLGLPRPETQLTAYDRRKNRG